MIKAGVLKHNEIDRNEALTLILLCQGILGQDRAVSDETLPESWLTNDDGILVCEGKGSANLNLTALA